MATASTAGPAPARALGVAGAGLAAASIGWSVVAARGSGGGWPVAALQAGCVAAYALGHRTGRWQPAAVSIAVAGGTLSAVVIRSVLPGPGPVSGPLGYTNAGAALYVLAALAALLGAAAQRQGPASAVAGPVAAAFVLAAAASLSVAAAVALGLGGLLLLARLVLPTRLLATMAAAVVVAAVGATAAVGVARSHGTRSPAAEALVSERRALLWRDAAVIARAHPVLGAGPGRFQVESPTARADRDARWAHSGFLQQGAEQGAVGLALLLGAFAWGFARLAAGPDDGVAVLGVAALAGLGLLASVDYVLHFPAVPLAAAAIVGAAAAPRPERPVSPRRPAAAAGSPD